MNKLDVIIPAYNAHKWIKDILKCLEKQTFKDSFLVTIIDDGSDENYNKITKDVKLNINIIKNKKNVGVAKARNKGIKNTESPYILFLDADDIIVSSTMIEKMYNLIKNNYCIVYAKELNNNLCRYHDYHMAGKMIARKVIEKYDLKVPNVKINEDISFMMNYYSVINEEEVYKIDELFYKYRHINNKSITSNYKRLINYDSKELFNAIDNAYKYAKKYNNYWLFKEKMYIIFLTLSKNYFDNVKIANENVIYSYLKRCKRFYNKYKFYIEYYRNNKKLNIIDEEYYKKFKKILNII